MEIEITPAGDGDRERLSALMELYCYDFSELLPIDVEENGRFSPPLDKWLDGKKHAFLARADGKLAGFALVQPGSYLSDDARVFDMAEFFVMRRYRRHGVGERMARSLFDRFAGPWEVREKKNNVSAIAFWRRIIGRYTNGSFEDLMLDDARWQGAVQRFDSSRR